MKRFISLTTLILFFSCNQNQQVLLKYTNTTKIDNNSYIKIDRHIIRHSSSAKQIRLNNVLPTGYVNLFDSKNSKAPVYKISNKQILEKLYKILIQTNEYVFDSIIYIDFNNKLIFSRKDGKPIKIKTSKLYPAEIKFRRYFK